MNAKNLGISVFSQLQTIAAGALDYMYQEGVIIYDDEHLAAYAAAPDSFPFDNFLGAMLSDVEAGDKLRAEGIEPINPEPEPRTREILNAFGSEKPVNDKIVKEAILSALNDFINTVY